MWSAFFALLTVLVIAIFPLYDQRRSEEVFRYVESQTGVPLKQYHIEGTKMFEIFIDKTKLWTNHTREFIARTTKEYL